MEVGSTLAPLQRPRALGTRPVTSGGRSGFIRHVVRVRYALVWQAFASLAVSSFLALFKPFGCLLTLTMLAELLPAWRPSLLCCVVARLAALLHASRCYLRALQCYALCKLRPLQSGLIRLDSTCAHP